VSGPPLGACRKRTFLSLAGTNSRNCNVKPALYAATATKTMQAATVNKSLQFRRRLCDFFAVNISSRCGTAFMPHTIPEDSTSENLFNFSVPFNQENAKWWNINVFCDITSENVYCG